MSQSEPTIVGGRYELGELLGRGGMAEVRKGVDTRLGRTVAVKRLRTDLASDATFQARFRREAQSSASLNHPSIVAVYDTGEELATDGTDVAQPYIVMEMVEGRTLRDVLREGRKILPERALEITAGVLSALDYSHRAGIIHRDIKPGNVMLTPAGDVKVMDFGIARAISDASSTMTQTAAVVGTAQYLSPEQARGETVDSRSDVYSTGCLLYELLTGRPPFVGESPVAVAYQHVREPAKPPSDLDTDIDPGIDAIVMKALAKPLEERYQSAAAMRSDIERYLQGHQVEAPAHVPPPAPAAPATAATAVVPAAAAAGVTERDRDEEPQGRNWGLVVIAVLTLALIGLSAALLPRLFESAPEKVRVPALIGLSEQDARELAGKDGFLVDVEYEPSSDVDADEVIRQTPNRDTSADPGSTITITVSTGKPMKGVPYVVGRSKEDARQILKDQGFKVKLKEVESDEAEGEVVATDPTAGEEVPEGSRIEVRFSDGPEKVPDVIGRNEAKASELITEAGFQVKVIYSSDTTEKKGKVIDQSPGGGETPPANSTITIVVSSYEEPTTDPPTTDPPTTDPTVDPTTGLPTDLPTDEERTPGATTGPGTRPSGR